MSFLDYRATLNPKDKYLRYFCTKPVSKWSFKYFQRHFSHKQPDRLKRAYKKSLNLIKHDKRDVPNSVLMHIEKLLQTVPAHTADVSPQVNIRNGNYYNINKTRGVVNVNCQSEAKIRNNVPKEDEVQETRVSEKRWDQQLALIESNTDEPATQFLKSVDQSSHLSFELNNDTNTFISDQEENELNDEYTDQDMSVKDAMSVNMEVPVEPVIQQKRSRGRPRKYPVVVLAPTVKRARGRPRKYKSHV